MTKAFHLLVIAVCCLMFPGSLLANSEPMQAVRVGVLAYNGEQQARARWQPTADYLARHIEGREFEIVPLTHEDFVHAINKGRLDFILTNPGHYITLEVKYGATRIATFKSRFQDQVLTRFSSVIFARKDSGLESLEDLKGHSLAAVSNNAFGGFQLARARFLDSKIDIFEDVSLRWMGFPHTDIVRAVVEGKVDAGTVRSGVLEKMAASGEIDLSRLHILGEQTTEGFPLRHSTKLYPEWPIARLPRTDSRLATQVAITLLQMPEDAPQALASEGGGWTIPLDYLQVHELFRRLQMPPYPPVPLALKDFWQSYRGWVFLIGLLFLVCVFTILYTLKINRELKISQQALSGHREKLEDTIQTRTAELNQLNLALQQDIESRIQFEHSLHEGCEMLQTLYTISNRNDLTRQQRIQSIIDMARQYFGEEMGVFSTVEGNSFIGSVFSPGGDKSAPMSTELALQALQTGQVVHLQNKDHWNSYRACTSPLPNQKSGLLEFATIDHENVDLTDQSINAPGELGMQIMHLLTQWLGNELMQLELENSSAEQQQQIQLRFSDITEREKEVLQLVADGESNKEIARKLDISTKTVELHRANLIRKAECNSSIQLVKLATAAKYLD